MRGYELFPVPLGDDLDGAVDHLDGRLVVDRVRRARDAGRPLLRLGHGVARQTACQVREDREVDDAQRAVVRRWTATRRSRHRSAGSSPCSRRSPPPRRSRAATAAGPPARTAASSGTGTSRRRRRPAGRRPPGPGDPALLVDAGQRGELQDAQRLPAQVDHGVPGSRPADEPPRLTRARTSGGPTAPSGCRGRGLGDRLAQQVDQRVVDAGVRDAPGREKKLQGASRIRCSRQIVSNRSRSVRR